MTTPTDKLVAELRAAGDPFERVMRLNACFNTPDDRGLGEWLPKAWPDTGDLRRLIAVVHQAAEALSSIRAEAVEEAAKVAEQTKAYDDFCCRAARKEIAAAIRALTQSQREG